MYDREGASGAASYVINLLAEDGEGLSTAAAATLNVNDVNEYPSEFIVQDYQV